jgi:hypothetical protein
MNAAGTDPAARMSVIMVMVVMVVVMMVVMMMPPPVMMMVMMVVLSEHTSVHTLAVSPRRQIPRRSNLGGREQ